MRPLARHATPALLDQISVRKGQQWKSQFCPIQIIVLTLTLPRSGRRFSLLFSLSSLVVIGERHFELGLLQQRHRQMRQAARNERAKRQNLIANLQSQNR